VQSAVVPAIIVVGTALSYFAAALVAIPVLVPIFNIAPALPFMIASLRRGQTGEAIGRMLVWAASLAVCATTLAYLAPVASAQLFLHGDAYRREMFLFIVTGQGAEGDIRQFLPQHAMHAAAFCGLALATGSILAMPMGAVLMNYMGHYVGTLAANSRQPALTMLLAWHPWSVIRIVSFVILGVVFSVPLLSRMRPIAIDRRVARTFMIVAGAGLIGDLVLKALLAPMWQRLLLRVVGW
jgi:hypothetical protein